ncbi:hypothetical protein Sjap_010575 [Stephania japonica]|uniref:Protein kinase domain-containing protein n=1 Tax=Stephania japonica TaxID=461633 RepID=A0AAP0P4A2_9MAGN
MFPEMNPTFNMSHLAKDFRLTNKAGFIMNFKNKEAGLLYRCVLANDIFNDYAMGCAQGRLLTSSPSHGVDGELARMKLANGYVGRDRVGGRRPMGEKSIGKGSNGVHRVEGGGVGVENSNKNKVLVVGGGVDGGEKGKVVVEGERDRVNSRGVGNMSRRISSKRHVIGDELVDGWPKWLTDNVSEEVLAGLVPKSAESYHKLDKVGQGTYSNVYKARDRETGKVVALKKVKFDTSEPESVKFMAREIQIIQNLDHTNVLKLEGLATSRMQYSLYLVFDFMQSDLARIIARPEGRLTEPQIKCYMQQLLSGLQHCHERGILHRDIKASNLLIDRHGVLKIADFGLANYFDPDQKKCLTNRVVTLWYRAPELLLGATDYGVGIDLWSAGCLMAEMFVGRPILPGRTEVEQLHRIFKLCGSPSEDYWKKLKLPTSFRPPQPYKPSLMEAFREFPASSLGLLTTLLALDPSYRGTAASALQSEFFTTSPLACSLSELPKVYREEDDLAHVYRKKNRSSKNKHSRAHRERSRAKAGSTEKSKGDSGSSKEV